MPEVLWWLALGSIGAAALLDSAVAGTAALVATIIATVVAIAALLVDRPGSGLGLVREADDNATEPNSTDRAGDPRPW